MQRIIAATDGSETGDRAVAAAIELAAKLAAELVLVHVVAAGAPAPSGLVRAPYGADLRELARVENVAVSEVLADRGADILAKAKARAGASGVRHIETEIRAGDPAESLIAVAKEKAADAIVIGRRGLGRLSGLLLGSVSQKLVTHAPCAVLIVP